MRLFVIMGVSGSGKTTVGEALAPRLGGMFIDGDDFHSPANIAKMKRGDPLTDADRQPWLETIGRELGRREGIMVAGCSALKRTYRDTIRASAGEPVCFVLLSGSPELIASRMADRKGHFMPASLLESQLATLELPGPDEDSVTVDIGPPAEEVAERITESIKSAGFGG